jgi:hypothetical protein
MFYDSNAFKPNIYVFSRPIHVAYIYIYSIGPTPKSIEYHFFGQLTKLPRRFLPDMSDLWTGHIRLARHVRLRARTCPGIGFLVYIRGLSAPL